jgi:CRISPR-associated protein Cas1
MTKRVLNTLFISTQKTRLAKDGEAIGVWVDREKRHKIPLHGLSSIVCFGGCYVTPSLMHTLLEAGIHVAYCTTSGKFLGRVEGLPSGNILLRKAQFRCAESTTESLELARSFVIGKLAGTRRFVVRSARENRQTSESKALQECADQLSGCLRTANSADSMDALRGAEGSGARLYFDRWPTLLRTKKFSWNGRNRRPPKDPLNALLSFGYTLLQSDCIAALASVGLDPAVGFLHQDRPGRLSLALDLMEEFRIPVVDRLVLGLVNTGQLGPSDFETQGSGAVMMSDDARRKFLTKYQEQKQKNLRHRFLEQESCWGMMPFLQALLLARTLRSDLDCYPPLEIR